MIDMRDGDHECFRVELEDGRKAFPLRFAKEVLDQHANPVWRDLRVGLMPERDHETDSGTVHAAVHEVDVESPVVHQAFELNRPSRGPKLTKREDRVEESAIPVLQHGKICQIIV